jgi:Spy/CpxP family protein refolding chaperone
MKMNKETLIALATIAGVLSLQPLARAAEVKDTTKPAAGDRGGALRDRIEEAVKDLNLTDEQKEKMQAIFRERWPKIRDLRQDTSLTQEEKQAKFKGLRDEIATEAKKVLTPEQFEKWKAKQGTFGAGQGGSGPQARLQDALQELNLTDEQKAQLKPLYQEHMEKLRDLRQDSSLSGAEKLEKVKAMQKELAPKIKKVLDADQFAKWEKKSNQWIEEMGQRVAQGKK